ncbi:MAG: cyclic nucleotide-binding domain-containing protein [Rhodospirillales bacterium]|nr:cyclic nucleotide-binding domain-containing protein [Rhodospirillales bacterium]
MWAEFIGYLAASLGLATFAMKGMLPLRALAVAMNIAFVAYGYLSGIEILWIAHLIQLPLNVVRLIEIWRTRQRAAKAIHEDLSIDPLLPFMLEVKRRKGTVLFSRGEPAEIMYYIARGTVRVVEIERLCRAGDLLGEIALFSPDRRRTATAVCESDCELFALTGKKATELSLEHPEFGLYLARLITARLIDQLGSGGGAANEFSSDQLTNAQDA